MRAVMGWWPGHRPCSVRVRPYLSTIGSEMVYRPGRKRGQCTNFLKYTAQAGVFDAEEVCNLTAAFDETWQAVQDSGGPFASNGEAEATRDLIALRIIAMARLGELDCGRLRAGALLYLARMKGTTAGNPGVT